MQFKITRGKPLFLSPEEERSNAFEGDGEELSTEECVGESGDSLSVGSSEVQCDTREPETTKTLHAARALPRWWVR